MTPEMRLLLINNYKEQEKAQQTLNNLTRCAGQPIEMVHHSTPGLATKIPDMEPDLLFLSGSGHLLTRPETLKRFREQIDLVKKAAFPVLGICFGHQLIGTAFGSGMSNLGQMVRRFEQVNVLDHHPVFDGLPTDIIVAESHRQVLTRVPAGFQRLARSSTSNIEAIRHETRPIYGFQFHPERADENHPHGQILIRNLMKLAGKA